MPTNFSGSTDILTKDHQNLKTLVSTLPEHSDSDLNGHITNEKLFGANNVTLGDAEEDEVDSWKNFGIWIEFCLNSPLIIGVFIGTIIFLILLIIGFCLVCKICRTDWPKLLRDAGFHQKKLFPQKKLKGAEYYKVNEKNTMNYNHGWEYKHATVKPVNTIPNVRRYEYTIERPAPPPPPPPPFPPPPEEDQMVTETFGPEYEEEDRSTLSTKESDNSTKKEEKRKPSNKKSPSTIQRPASCSMVVNESYFQVKRPESWDVSSWPREPVNHKDQSFPMTTFGGAKRKNIFRTQIEEHI